MKALAAVLVLGCSSPEPYCGPKQECRLSEAFDASSFDDDGREAIGRAVAQWRKASHLVDVRLSDEGRPVLRSVLPEGTDGGTWSDSGRITISELTSDVETVFAHELGHFMGLEHSEDPNDIMWAYVEPKRTVSIADAGALERLYK